MPDVKILKTRGRPIARKPAQVVELPNKLHSESRPAEPVTTDDPAVIRWRVSEGKLKRFRFRTVEEGRAEDIKRADAYREASLLQLQAMAPVLRLIEADKKAKAASDRLAKAHHNLSLSALGPKTFSDPGGSPISWFSSLDPGMNVLGIPYDGERQGPTHGAPVTAQANRNSGEMTATVPLHQDVTGTRTAEASIQVILDAKKPGILSVRPYIQYEGLSIVTGHILSAFSRGVIFISAAKWFDPSTAKGAETVIWSHTSQSLNMVTPSGAISASTLSLDMPITPGEPLIVSIGVRITGNQSGQKYMGLPFFLRSYSYFRSRLWAKLPFLPVKLN